MVIHKTVRSKQRTKRRRFHGNRFTNNTTQNVTENKVVTQQTVCTSARKLKESDISSNNVMEPDNVSNFNMIINCEVLKNLIDSFMKCQICNSDIAFSIDITKRMGLCNTIDLKCIDCNWNYSRETSYQSSKVNSKTGRNFYDINIQSVTAFRKIGKGLEGISSFCRLMNMPPP